MMFFINQLTQQFQNTLFSYQQEMGPGSHDFDAERLAQESAQREAEDPRSEEDRLAEVDALATETTAEMRDRMGDMRDEQGRIARAEVERRIGEGEEGSADTAIEQQRVALDSLFDGMEDLATELGYDDFLQEVDEALEGMTDEEAEEYLAQRRAEFEAMRDERLAELAAEAARIGEELARNDINPDRRRELTDRAGAVAAMETFYGNGGSLNGSAGSIYEGGIGISPDQIEQYGERGANLARFLEQSGFPAYNGQPNYCGQNVGEGWNDFCRSSGIPELQINDRPRHGYRWHEICQSRPNDFVRVDCTPQEAPAGAIISYNRGTGGSEARQAYGHVEIALGENRGYYFGTVAGSAGGSNRNPEPGSYTIWMPVGERTGENP